jgi:hypothetical protein
VEAIPHPLTCRPVRSIPSRFVHRVIASVPHNPPRIRRRHQKEPAKSHRWCRAWHTIWTETLRLGRERWLPLGSNGFAAWVVFSTALLPGPFCDHLRDARAAQQTREIRLAACKRASSPSLPLCSHQRMQQSPRCCLLACSLRRVFVGVSICGHCVLFSTHRRDDSHVHASLHQDHESVYIIYVKSSHSTLLVPGQDCKSYASL